MRFFSHCLMLGLLLSSVGCQPEASSDGANAVATEASADAWNAATPAAMAPTAIEVALDLSGMPETMPATTTLLVFIRAPGQRMPLAVQQFDYAQAPTNLTFPGNLAAGMVEVVARVSPTGRVDRQADDIEVSAAAEFTHPASQLHLRLPAAPVAAGQIEVGQIEVGQIKTGQTNAAQAVAASAGVQIQLSARIEDKLDPAAAVFVVAKAPGSPMPVAVKRLQLQELPIAVKLTDADSIMPTRTLSSSRSVAISAHVSRSGDASRAPGDWMGQGQADPGGGSYTLVIDQRIN